MLKKIGFLSLILCLAIALRFYKLAEVPHGMAWDEAAIAYNGFAIFNFRRDEWLQKLPISFRSFGDYKAPLAIYQSGFSTAIFGMNLFAVRLPFAVYGVLAVLGIYLLFKEWFYKDKDKERWALLASFILAISPWHIHYSRIAFESGLALNLMIWALLFFNRYLRLEKIINLLLAAFLSVLTIYAYHSSKITVPLLFIFLFLSNFAFFKTKFRHLLITCLFGLIMLYPFFYDSFFANGLARASATLFSQGMNFFELSQSLFSNFLSYFSLRFLVFGENMGNYRHGDGRFGVIEPISLIMIIIFLFMKKHDMNFFSLALMIIVIGLVPAIISDGQCSSNRSILALPGFILLTVVAIKAIFESLQKHRKIFFNTLIAAYLVFLAIYQFNYYENYAKQSAENFMDGYLETFDYLRSLDKSNVKQIVFTNDYQQAYIYALFSFTVNPIAYQGGILNLFFFTNKIDQSDLEKENTIVVASKFDQMGERKADEIINGSDGKGRFFIYLPL